MYNNGRAWWIQLSWLERQIVALEAVGSNPIIHPTFFIYRGYRGIVKR